MRKLSEVTYCLSLGVAAEAWGHERKRRNPESEGEGKRLVRVSITGSLIASSPKSSQG